MYFVLHNMYTNVLFYFSFQILCVFSTNIIQAVRSVEKLIACESIGQYVAFPNYYTLWNYKSKSLQARRTEPIIFRGKIIPRTCPQQCGMVRVQTPFSRSAGLTLNKDLKLKRMTNHSGLGLKPAHTIIIVQNQLLTKKVLENINLVEPFFYKFLCLGLHQYFIGNVLI